MAQVQTDCSGRMKRSVSLNKIASALACAMAFVLASLELSRRFRAETALIQKGSKPVWCGAGSSIGHKTDSRLASLAQCGEPPVEKDPTGFPAPEFGPAGGQYAESDYGWTTAGTLDNRYKAAAQFQPYPASLPGTRRGFIKEYKDRAPDSIPAGKTANRGGLWSNCGCAICPCRGDGDIDIVDNGDWAWPVETRPLRETHVAAVKAPPPAPELPCCEKKQVLYTTVVKKIPEEYEARVIQPTTTSSSSSTSTSHEKIVYKTLYKEKTVYVPVYDDPYWNPATDGRLSGEGVGLPEDTESGALAYPDGAWFEMAKRRRSLLDPLGGSVDTDRDVDAPSDLGVWWPDSLPRAGGLASSLSDGPDPSNMTVDNEFEA